MEDRSTVPSLHEFGKCGYFGGSINARVPEDSPLLREVIRELWNLGKRPVVNPSIQAKGGSLEGNTYVVNCYQKPSDEELDGADYLQWLGGPETGFGHLGHDWERELWFLESEQLNTAAKYGTIGLDVFACSSAFREFLEQKRFSGIEFAPAPLHPNPEAQPKELVHLITSTILLPPSVLTVSPEEDYTPARMRFNTAEFEALGSFDIAKAREPKVNNPPFPSLVVSQRFRQWMLSEGFCRHQVKDGTILRTDFQLIELVSPGDPEPDPPLAAICRELGIPLTNVPG